MTKTKNGSPPSMNKFGVEPRDLTAAQRRELFADYKNSHPDPMPGTDYCDDPPSVKPEVEDDDFSEWGGD
jgi:hypothetical protein